MQNTPLGASNPTVDALIPDRRIEPACFSEVR